MSAEMINNHKKVVFLDVDGTMVNDRGEIPESAKEAVRRAKANGHKMVVCTGRSRFQIYDELLELGFSGIVGAAGVFVIADGKEIYHAYIDEEHRKSVYDYLEGNGFLFCYQADDGVVLNRRSSEGILEIYRKMGMSEERLVRLTGNMHLTEEPWKNPKNEKLLYYNAPFPVAKVHADLEPYFDTVAISGRYGRICGRGSASTESIKANGHGALSEGGRHCERGFHCRGRRSE